MQELVPFVLDRNWSVEWTGNTLLVYEIEKIVVPSELYSFADDVALFTDMLREASAAFSEQLDDLVNASVAGA